MPKTQENRAAFLVRWYARQKELLHAAARDLAQFGPTPIDPLPLTPEAPPADAYEAMRRIVRDEWLELIHTGEISDLCPRGI
jgi:hypothetical protein